ncbi:Trp biosynthesis-associated membrane protein [Bogoriella caseilytica]|uniref:Tryptophan-associated transmembrane protein n=1 Tax=Bogoriella caseilytica TaxID=56055 RepID=A0A3N2B956_9MICO|nr:Trp biosynthesis-associated membrane protein [Bogoriella caseilytica]ROR71672.1 tryptophan-associated transmembrane protein [Bogoriella caseilytica]
MSAEPRTPARFTRGRAALATLALAALMLVVASLPWATGEAESVLGLQPVTVSGSEAAPATLGLALIVGAAGLVIAIGRRVGAVLGALALAAAGATTIPTALAVTRDPAPALRRAAAEASGVPEVAGASATTPWPTVTAVLGGLAIVLAGVIGWQMRRWPARADRRFERATAAKKASAQEGAPAQGVSAVDAEAQHRTRAMDDWDAQARGEDPTDEQR